MKKIFYGFLMCIVFYSCENNNFENDSFLNDKSLQLEESLKLNQSTTYVSDNFLNFGVTNIKVVINQNSHTFNFTTVKKFNINSEEVDLSDYTVILKDNKLYLKNDPNLQLSIYENQPYVFSSDYEGFANSSQLFDNKNFSILMFVMKEITITNSSKIDTKLILDSSLDTRGSCSFWDTYYVYGTGASKSVSQANLAAEIDDYWVSIICTPIGDSDTSCLYDEHMCISTQAFCCQ